MNNCSIIFIGLDTHKTFTQLAVLKDERGDKPASLGRINTNKSAFIKLARQLQSKYPKATLHFIYEAGLDLQASNQPRSLLLYRCAFSHSQQTR